MVVGALQHLPRSDPLRSGGRACAICLTMKSAFRELVQSHIDNPGLAQTDRTLIRANSRNFRVLSNVCSVAPAGH